MQKGFITNIVIIIIVLAIVFLSQQPYYREYGRNLYSQGINWFQSNVYPRVSGEVEQKGAIIQQEITKQKNNIAQNIWENIKNYFAGIFSKTTGTPVR